MDKELEYILWLKDCVFFDERLRLDVNENLLDYLYQRLCNGLFTRMIYYGQTALDCVLANLVNAKEQNKTLAITMRTCEYKPIQRYGTEWMSYDRVSRIVYHLEELGLISRVVGYKDNKFGNNQRTKIFFTNTINDILPSGIRTKKISLSEVIYLRDDDKMNVDYSDNRFTNACRKNILNYNSMIEEHQVEYKNVEEHEEEEEGRKDLIGIIRITDKNIYRIFSRLCWNKYGRFHSSYQSIKNKLRPTIFIDNEPTVELDFDGLHVRMLYHELGIECECLPYIYDKVEHPLERDFMKSIVLKVINAKNRHSVSGSFRNIIYKELIDKKYKLRNRIIDLDKMLSLNLVDPNDFHVGPIVEYFIDMFISNHPKITHRICSDAGIDLMFKDSIIMDGILKRTTELNIPVLPYHDSVRFPTRFESIVYMIMTEEYEKVMKFKPIIDRKG